MTLFDRIRHLVSEGQTEQSIEELIGYVKEGGKDVTDHLILLKSRMKTLNNAIITGTINETEASIERAKINESILRVLNEITPTYLQTESGTKKRFVEAKPNQNIKWSYIIIGIISLLGLGIYFIGTQVTNKTPSLQIQNPIYGINKLVNNEYSMEISVPGRILHSKGKSGQLVSYFMMNSVPLLSQPNEVTFNSYGYVACSTPRFEITSDDYVINDQLMYIPYRALYLPNTGMQQLHNLQFYVTVYVDNIPLQPTTAAQWFQVRW